MFRGRNGELLRAFLKVGLVVFILFFACYLLGKNSSNDPNQSKIQWAAPNASGTSKK